MINHEWKAWKVVNTWLGLWPGLEEQLTYRQVCDLAREIAREARQARKGKR